MWLRSSDLRPFAAALRFCRCRSVLQVGALCSSRGKLDFSPSENALSKDRLQPRASLKTRQLRKSLDDSARPYDEKYCVTLVIFNNSRIRGVVLTNSSMQYPCLIAEAFNPNNVPSPELSI